MSGARLAGKVAVVTGGSSGIGRTAALLFAREGAAVGIGALDPVAGGRVVAEIETAGCKRAFFTETDVRHADQVEALVAQTEERFGRVDVLYSSAGIMPTGTATETSDEDWHLAIDVNLGGPFQLARAGIPALQRAGGGSIVLTASELGLVGARATVAYCAAKGGVVNMTRALAIDCGPLGVRVNCLCPGPVDTPMLRRWFAEAADPAAVEATQTEPVLLGRIARPEEIAEAALFLASDASSFMTGSALVVDGGVTSWYGL